MRTRRPQCTCAYCTFYRNLLKYDKAALHYTVFQEDWDIESMEEAFLTMDYRANVPLTFVSATYFN